MITLILGSLVFPYSCKMEEEPLLMIPKEIQISKIFVSNIPENDSNGIPWDQGSTADISFTMGRATGGGRPLILSEVVFDIDHSISTQIPLDSIVKINDTESSFLWEVEHWDQDDPFGPTDITIGSGQFRFPFISDEITESFIYETIAGLGFRVKVEFDVQYVY